MSVLIIVESPSKARSIEAMLGSDYKVAASFGHIRDLPDKEMGLSKDGQYTPDYILTPTGRKAVKYIKDLAKNASDIYLASDPDREGEAIAWHLGEVLRLKKAKRITYNEITKEAILRSLGEAREVDMDLVRAQEARRTVDRLVGYKVSPVLSSFLKEKASAGRVQTPALFLVVQRESDIQRFKSVKHFGAVADFGNFKATWDKSNFITGDNKYILDRNVAEAVTHSDSFTVVDFSESTTKQSPPPPFITSTLQRAGEQKLNIPVKEVMNLAQHLFEQGKITYMRTDSPVLSDEFFEAATDYCKKNNMPSVAQKRIFKSKESAQEAHEAIRPTDITVIKAGESELENRLYTMIRERALACVMPDAEFAVRTVKFKSVPANSSLVVEIFFNSKGKTKTVPGWTILFESAAEDEEANQEAEQNNTLPKLEIGETLTSASVTITEHATAPPKRFTEASLIQELERQEIGRPATYASILDTLFSSGFATKQKKNIIPSALGIKIIQALANKFSFVDLQFTRILEQLLDKIAVGENSYAQVVSSMDTRLEKELASFSSLNNLATCPTCKTVLSFSKDVSFCTASACNKTALCPLCGDFTRYIKTSKGTFYFCAHVKNKKCKGGYKLEGSILKPFKEADK